MVSKLAGTTITLVLILCCTGPLARAEATLSKAFIQFHTTSDDKDKDTKLSVWLSVGASTIAKKVGFAQRQ